MATMKKLQWQKKVNIFLQKVYGSTQDTDLKARLIKLECYFTWALNEKDADLHDLLNRLEEQFNLDLGKKAGVARTYNYVGFVKFLQGSNSEALSNCEKSVELFKTNGNDSEKMFVVAYGNLAWLHYHMGNFAECEIYLNKLGEIKEKYPAVPYAEVLGEKGWTFLKFSHKYYERAIECFKKALEVDPEDSELNSGLAIALYRTEMVQKGCAPETSNAVIHIRRTLDTNPDDDTLKVLLALRLAVFNKYREAENLIQQALERSPDHPHVIRYVAKYLRNEGSVDDSIALLEGVLPKVSNKAFIHYQLGLCYKRKIINMKTAGNQHTNYGEIKRAQEQSIYHFEMAVNLKDSFVDAMSDLALQYGMGRNISRAEEMFQIAFQKAKEIKDNYQNVLVRFGQFQQYCIRCEPEAIKYYIECLKMNPNEYVGRKSAKCLMRITWRRLKNNPNDGEAYGIRGIVHKKQGEKQQAIECFEKALTYVDNEEYLSYLCELRL